jgi:hypothetical protein
VRRSALPSQDAGWGVRAWPPRCGLIYPYGLKGRINVLLRHDYTLVARQTQDSRTRGPSTADYGLMRTEHHPSSLTAVWLASGYRDGVGIAATLTASFVAAHSRTRSPLWHFRSNVVHGFCPTSATAYLTIPNHRPTCLTRSCTNPTSS